jgi:hypothetical protein
MPTRVQPAEITHWCDALKEAISGIPDCFYRDYPLEWLVENVNESNKNAWKATLVQYNERDWCYELYHQLRLILGKSSSNLPCLSELFDGQSESHVRLSGESSKQATYNATDASMKDAGEIRWSKNRNCRIPDILYHDPRTAKNQIFAIEVKRERCIGQVGCKDISDDLVGLVEYTHGLDFRLGFFVGLGINDKIFRSAAKAAAKDFAPETHVSGVIDQIYVCLIDDSQSHHDQVRSAADRHSGFKPLVDFLG